MAPDNNRTLKILDAAEKGGYGVVAQICYDVHAVIALVRAAESQKSPAILQLFPVTLRQLGPAFLTFCLTAAGSASVPIAVHLDHATTEDDIELALSLAESSPLTRFDSIMVDASHFETDEENIAFCKGHVTRAAQVGVAVEVELGRLEGGEAGLRVIDGAMLTDPRKGAAFIEQTGATMLAPSIGNLHGRYLREPSFRQDILRELREQSKGRGYLVLHGTDDLPDSLFQTCIANGVSKVNTNSWGRDPFLARLGKGIQSSEPYPDALEAAMGAFAAGIGRLMDVLGSSGRA